MNDIARVFSTHPLLHTEDDRKAIVAEFRAKRAVFKSAPTATKAPKAPAAKINLDDLGDL